MRMHEILGVEPGERFTIIIYPAYDVVWVDRAGYPYCEVNGNSKSLPSDTLVVIINNPELIIRKPRLTDGQIEALLILRIHFGAHWLTTDGPEDGRFVEVFSDKEKPKINKGFWFGKDWFNLGFETPIRKKIEPLLNPNEPLNIVHTLKNAGVEV